MIVAGEASGDMHAGELIHKMHEVEPDIEFYGIGGTKMREQGMDILFDAKNLAVVGLIEVIAHRKIIFAALNSMRECLQTRKPDLLILVDYAEFNLKLAADAKALGIKVLFYISPQVWAWRQSRVHKIKQRVDMMAVIFPFEADFFRKYNVPVEYVGHPLVGKVHANVDKNTFLHELGYRNTAPVIGLFPGSRPSEIKRLLPDLVNSAQLIKQQFHDAQFILPIASTLDEDFIQPYLDDSELTLQLVKNRTYDVINACDAIMTVSGTVTLEIALLKTPFLIINRLSWLSYFLVKRMIKIKFIGLCNIVAGREVAREFIQHQAKPANIAAEMIKILSDKEYAAEISNNLACVEEKLVSEKEYKPIHQLALEMLN